MSKNKMMTRLASGLGAAALTIALSVVVAPSATAATSCSSLSTDWNRVVGSCTGYPTFTINWTCWGSSYVNQRTFSTASPSIGYSFNFEACGLVGVTGVWSS